MPPSAKPAAKRGRPAFKPPRPATKATKTKTTTPRRKSAPAKPSFIDSAAEGDEEEDDENDDDDDDDPELVSSHSRNASASEESDALPPTTRAGTQDAPPTIPPALLTRLLHHHLQDDKIRIGKEAKGVVGKYMETFVREAIARAAFERSEAGGQGIGGHFLEVSGSMLCWGMSADLGGTDRLRIWRSWRRSCCSTSKGFLGHVEALHWASKKQKAAMLEILATSAMETSWRGRRDGFRPALVD